MERKNFKDLIDAPEEIFNCQNLPVLVLSGRHPSLLEGEGAILKTEKITGNIRAVDWRLDSSERFRPNKSDILPYNLIESVVLKEPLNPCLLSVGLEAELQLSNPGGGPGDATCFDKNAFGKTNIAPEIRRDGLELAMDPTNGKYEEIKNIFRQSISEALKETEAKGQILTATGACPYPWLSERHPHPYLAAAVDVVAKNNLVLDSKNEYYKNYVAHLLPDWDSNKGLEERRIGVEQFSSLGLQTNIKIPFANENLAAQVSNYLMLSPISLIKSSLLYSTPFINGIYTGRLDARSSAKEEILSTAGYQYPFLFLDDDLERLNEAIISGKAPTIARARCRGDNGVCVFHGQLRIRSDRPIPTFEDMMPPTHPLDTVTAAYAYLKTCDVSYLTYCWTNNLEPDRAYFGILGKSDFLSLRDNLEVDGASQFSENLRSYLDFMQKWLKGNDFWEKDSWEAFDVIENCLKEPDNYGVEHYLDPKSSSFGKGTLSEHLIGNLKKILNGKSLPVFYDEDVAEAIVEVMHEKYWPALLEYYMNN